jgi:DMSO/TMAO reductase YedYZ heme-binding membrane subunit
MKRLIALLILLPTVSFAQADTKTGFWSALNKAITPYYIGGTIGFIILNILLWMVYTSDKRFIKRVNTVLHKDGFDLAQLPKTKMKKV